MAFMRRHHSGKGIWVVGLAQCGGCWIHSGEYFNTMQEAEVYYNHLKETKKLGETEKMFRLDEVSQMELVD